MCRNEYIYTPSPPPRDIVHKTLHLMMGGWCLPSHLLSLWPPTPVQARMHAVRIRHLPNFDSFINEQTLFIQQNINRQTNPFVLWPGCYVICTWANNHKTACPRALGCWFSAESLALRASTESPALRAQALWAQRWESGHHAQCWEPGAESPVQAGSAPRAWCWQPSGSVLRIENLALRVII